MKFVTALLVAASLATASATSLPRNVSTAQPIIFTRNDGQIAAPGADVRYSVQSAKANYFFCADGVVADIKDNSQVLPSQNGFSRGHVVKQSFLGRTNVRTEITGVDELESRSNYFLGNDRSEWHRNVPSFSQILYTNVWKGIDMAYYGEESRLKYDVIVHPGSDVSNIRFRYDGADRVALTEDGSLAVATTVGDITEQKPFAYQRIDGEKKEIKSEFHVDRAGEISFTLGAYNKALDVVIDPLYSTYLGGQGQDGVLGMAVDGAGNAYVTGITASQNFPTVTGAYQDTLGGQQDIFVSKINPSGTKLLYSTYIGGLNNDAGYGIAVDIAGEAYVTGSTNSVNFPITVNANQKTIGGATSSDAFVLELDSNGSSLLYSSFLGGNGIDIGYRIALDKYYNSYIVGSTQSLNFPVTPILTAYQKTLKGNADAFIVKMTPAGTVTYSTYVGGSQNESAYSVCADATGNAYITGFTTSSDYPVTTTAKFQKGNDVFVTKMNPDGSALVASTLLGGVGTDDGRAIAIDPDSNIYVAGTTSSKDFPATPNAFQLNIAGNTDYFVTKLAPRLNQLRYSTFLGGSQRDEVQFGESIGLALDAGRNAFITGATSSRDFPVTKGAFQVTMQGQSDAFVSKLSTDGSSLSYSTYLGGTFGPGGPNSPEEAHDIAVDNNNGVFVAGITNTFNFPVTQSAFQRQSGGSIDGFVTRLWLVSAIASADSVGFHLYSCDDYADNILNVRDTLDAPLIIDSVSITGPNKSDFAVIAPTQFPFMIKADGAATVAIRYTPSPGSVGIKTAQLNIYSNDNIPSSDALRTITLLAVRDSVGVETLVKSLGYGTLACEDRWRDTMVSIRNTGSTSMLITPTFQGSGATAFSATPANAIVGAGATKQFVIRFAPSGGGAFDATALFTTEQCEMSDTIHLAGIKNSPASVIGSPATVDFGTLVCDAQKDETIVVINNGSVSVTLDPATVSGTGFSLVSPTTAVTLAPGENQIYTVRFSTATVGDYAGSFSASGMPCYISTSHVLIGKKDTLSIKANKKSIDFGKLPCQRPQVDSFVQVRNFGKIPVTIIPTIQGFGATSFRVLPPVATIDSNKTQNFTIRFQPGGAGVYDADVYFGSPACTGINITHVHGEKIAGTTITATPSQLDFGDAICDTLRDSVIVIKNLGPDTITLNMAQVFGAGFSILSPTTPQTILAGDSVVYHIRFNPGTVVGTYNGQFRVTSGRNDCFVSSTNALVGRKDSVSILTATKSVNFDTLECNDPYRDTTIVVKNLGSISTTTIPAVSGSGATSFTVSPPSATIDPGKSKTFVIHFQPSGAGSFDAHVTFADSTCAQTDTVHLAGAKNSTVNVVATPATLDFGKTNCGTIDSFITVKNLAKIPVTLDVPTTSGAGFMVTSSSVSTTLAPGDSIVYTIRFDPQGSAGIYAGNFGITGSPCGFKSSHILLGKKDSIAIETNTKAVVFADLGCDSTFRDTVVAVYNSGEEEMTVNSSIAGSGATSFSVSPLSATITPGGVALFTIHFQPSGNALFDARIDFSGSPCSVIDTTHVRGRKIANGSIAGAPAFIDFGDYIGCEPGNDSTITVRNTGAINVTLAPAAVAGAGFSVVSPTGSVMLTPGSNQNYVVRFAPPVTSGVYNGSFTIDASPCNLRTSHVLRGSRGAQPAYTQAPKNVDFGVVAIDNTESSSVTLKNNSSVDVRIGQITFVPAFPATVAPSLPVTLAAGQTTSFIISATPQTIGVQTAQMRVRIDSSCVDSVVYTVRVEAIPMSSCAQALVLSTVKPSETTSVPIVVENTTRLVNADSVTLVLTLNPDLLKIIGVPTSRYGMVKNYVYDENVGAASFTVRFTSSLDAPKDTVASFTAMALLATHADGTINVTGATMWQKGRTFSSPTCPTNFVIDSSGCVLTGNLQSKSTAHIASIYPNPSRDDARIVVNVTGKASQYIVNVTDVFGREVERFAHVFAVGTTEFELSTKEYSSGIYFVRLVEDGKPVTSRSMNVSK